MHELNCKTCPNTFFSKTLAGKYCYDCKLARKLKAAAITRLKERQMTLHYKPFLGLVDMSGNTLKTTQEMFLSKLA